MVMRRSWPCGCVTVTLVGGLALASAEASSVLRAEAGRFLELEELDLARVWSEGREGSEGGGWGVASADRRVVTEELASRSLVSRWPWWWWLWLW